MRENEDAFETAIVVIAVELVILAVDPTDAGEDHHTAEAHMVVVLVEILIVAVATKAMAAATAAKLGFRITEAAAAQRRVPGSYNHREGVAAADFKPSQGVLGTVAVELREGGESQWWQIARDLSVLWLASLCCKKRAGF